MAPCLIYEAVNVSDKIQSLRFYGLGVIVSPARARARRNVSIVPRRRASLRVYVCTSRDSKSCAGNCRERCLDVSFYKSPGGARAIRCAREASLRVGRRGRGATAMELRESEARGLAESVVRGVLREGF